jgi:hypothetical protein
MVSGGRMTDVLEGIRKEAVVDYMGFCHGICLEGAWKIVKNLSQDS